MQGQCMKFKACKGKEGKGNACKGKSCKGKVYNGKTCKGKASEDKTCRTMYVGVTRQREGHIMARHVRVMNARAMH
jgi:hypothetical protein